MKSGRASRSAEGVTLARALESARPPGARVCCDPFAVRFLGREGTIRYKIIMNPWLRRIAAFLSPDPVPIAILGYVPLRTRFIDDRLQECIKDGLEQLVILGAGFDSRAYRFDELVNGIQVYEVDHPNTQKVKLDRLEKIVGRAPNHVTHVPVNFEKDDLYEMLRKHGYDKSLKTLFIWEGVTYYLEQSAVDHTLEFVSSKSKPGSSIIFDYLPLHVINRTSTLPMAAAYLDYMVKNMGEPCKFGIDPESLDEFLSKRGFEKLKAVTVDQCKREYHTESHKGFPVLNIFLLAHVAVRNSSASSEEGRS